MPIIDASTLKDVGVGDRSSKRISDEISVAHKTYKELNQFETQLKEASFIEALLDQNVFMPPGFNQNCVKLIKFGEGSKKNMDLSALIACALSSNLYLNGLTHLEYLNMQDQIHPYDALIDEDGNRRQSDVYDSEIKAAAADKFDQN